jgi:hypothetical protein
VGRQLLSLRALPVRDRSPRHRALTGVRLRPETNGVIEKFLQTLEQQVPWIERFDTLEQLRARVRAFAALLNKHWLLERHGDRLPRQPRAALTAAEPAMA